MKATEPINIEEICLPYQAQVIADFIWKGTDDLLEMIIPFQQPKFLHQIILL